MGWPSLIAKVSYRIPDLDRDTQSLLSLPLPLLQSRAEKREKPGVPRFTAGHAVGPLALRPPRRRWEDGGTTDLCAWRVNSRIFGPRGDGVVAAPSPVGIKVPQFPPHRDEALCSGVEGLKTAFARRSVRSAGVGFLDVVEEARPSSASVDFVPRLCPRRVGVPSDAGVEVGGVCTGGSSPAVLFAVFLQVVLLSRVGGDLTTGRSRGVSPVDVLSSSPRSRRQCRVSVAATYTRLCPLTSPSGDLAGVRVCFAVVSGEMARPALAAADRAWSRRRQGPSCNFVVLQGVFCKSLDSCSVSGWLLYVLCFFNIISEFGFKKKKKKSRYG